MISWQKYNKYDRGIKSHIKMKKFGLGAYIDLRIGYIDVYLGPLALHLRDYDELPF